MDVNAVVDNSSIVAAINFSSLIVYKRGHTVQNFSSGEFLSALVTDFLRRQEVNDELGGFPGPLQSHRVTAVVQQRHLAVWQRCLQHCRPRHVHHLREETALLAAWHVCGFW